MFCWPIVSQVKHYDCFGYIVSIDLSLTLCAWECLFSSHFLLFILRYFKEKIKNEEEEKRLLLDRLSKYKELMEEHKRKDEVNKKKFCNSKEASESTMATFELPGGHAISARDIERMIASNSIHSMEVNKSNQVYLWNLLVALFDG